MFHWINSTWQSKPGEVAAAVEVALQEGYKHIDGAFIYMNEGEIGEMLQKCFKEGVIKGKTFSTPQSYGSK